MTLGADHLLAEQTIAGKYRVLRLLGEGGMGCVYACEQRLGTTTRLVAVKTLHKHLSHDRSIQARFQREVATVSALEHPNTIQVFDFGLMEDGTLYIVMEYLQGRSVADVLEKDGPMPPERVADILRQVVGSLEEAHRHGIVHRDLKPENVVLTDRAGQKDWVKVLDFGIAKRSTEQNANESKLTQEGAVLGTPPYMSPEQFTGIAVDARSDIYALGVMTYEMLTGRLPWEASTVWAWASKHMTEPPFPLERQPLGARAPGPMREAIGRALAKNKEERFASVRDFLDAFSGGAATPAVGTGTGALRRSGAPARPAADRDQLGQARTETGPPPMGAPRIGAPDPFSALALSPTNATFAGNAPPRKGGARLAVGFVVLAGIFVAVGAAYFLGAKKRAATPDPVATSVPPSASASTSAPAETSAQVTPKAPPAESVSAKTPPALHPSNGGSAPHPSAARKPAPATVDPPECFAYRAKKVQPSTPAKTLAALELQCKNAGGTP